MIEKQPSTLTVPTHRNRLLAAAILIGAFLAVPVWAASADRTVEVRVPGDPRQFRIEIYNPTPETVTFTLGLNDQLFENKEALTKAIASAKAEACKGLSDAAAINGPCAAFERISAAMNHHIELTDQFEKNVWTRTPRFWMASPMLAVNSFGFGTCGTFSYVLAKIWNAMGYEVRLRELNGHTVTEVLVDGKWRLFDGDLRGFFVDGKRVAGIDDLFAKPDLARKAVSLEGTRPADFPSSGLEYYPELLRLSTGPWRDTKAVPPGSDDWRELTFTLPPFGRVIFPEPEKNRCLYPEYIDLAVEYPQKKVVDPPYQFAVMEIPSGSRGDIQNGLFPALITGDFSFCALYNDSTELTRAYDQLNSFRHARRYAREFRDFEARSEVKVHYMLSANVALREKNQVRLHGEKVSALDVTLIDAPQAAGSEPPCIDPPGKRAVPVRAATATTNAYGNEALAANLIDGKLSTDWVSAILYKAEPQRVVLDLGTPQLVRGIRWAPASRYGSLSPRSMTVVTSRDGNDLQSATKVDNYEPSHINWLEREFEPRLARYVIITMTPKPTPVRHQFQATLGEIEVLGAQSMAASTAPAANQ